MKHLSFCAMVVLAGCAHGDNHDPDPARNMLADADALEREALRYGSIWVGAVRVASYDSEDLRKERDDRHEALRKEWELAAKIRLSDFKPESIDQRSQRTSATFGVEAPGGTGALTVSAGAKRAAPSSNENHQTPAPLDAIGPNPTDLLVRKLALLNRIQSELEEDELSDFSAIDPLKYRRIQLSLSLTAWTQPPARAAVVYMDVYPYNGDRGCHEVADKAAGYREVDQDQTDAVEADQEKAKAVEALRQLFNQKFLEEAFDGPTPELPPHAFAGWLGKGAAAYGLCHAALETYHLLPRLVKVESLGDTIFAVKGEHHEVDINGKGKAPLVNLEGGHETRSDLAEEDITATTLSFAAGSRRAGWFFMAKGKSGTAMKPVERRVRLVIDVPISLSRLELHVHKSFVGENEQLVSGFEDQMDKSVRARYLLDRIEAVYPTDPKCPREQLFCSPTQWQLTKTRARNLADHSWSERLIVDVDRTMASNRVRAATEKSASR